MTENPLALLVDDLLAFPERNFHRVVEPCKTVGTDKAVLLEDTVDLLRDDAAGLELTDILLRRGGVRETPVLDLLGRRGSCTLRAATTTKKTFQE